jgi:hypothetical protein
MTETTHPSLEDLAYVRSVAESGARAPLLGGRFMAWWGLLVTIGWTLQHFALAGTIGDGETIFAWIWLGFVLLGLGGQWVLVRTMPEKSGAGSAGNRASRSVWVAAACGIGAVSIGAAIASQSGAGPGAFDWIVPVGFAVYACALIVTGALAGDRTTVVAGAGAIAMAGIFAALILHPDRYLVAAAGVALTVLLPGLVLLRAEPRAKD